MEHDIAVASERVSEQLPPIVIETLGKPWARLTDSMDCQRTLTMLRKHAAPMDRHESALPSIAAGNRPASSNRQRFPDAVRPSSAQHAADPYSG